MLAACAASFGLAVPVGFLTDGWVTGERAKMLAETAAQDARADLAASVCVGRFMAAPYAAARLDALHAQAPWYRSVVLEDAGWAALPALPNLRGSKEPVAGAADLCARRLMALPQPSASAGEAANSPVEG